MFGKYLSKIPPHPPSPSDNPRQNPSPHYLGVVPPLRMSYQAPLAPPYIPMNELPSLDMILIVVFHRYIIRSLAHVHRAMYGT